MYKTCQNIPRFTLVPLARFLAEILKMPVWNSNHKVYTCPDLAIHLFQMLIPTSCSRLLCIKKCKLHLSMVLDDNLLEEYLVSTPQGSQLNSLERNFCLSKRCFSGDFLYKRSRSPCLYLRSYLYSVFLGLNFFSISFFRLTEHHPMKAKINQD